MKQPQNMTKRERNRPTGKNKEKKINRRLEEIFFSSGGAREQRKPNQEENR